MKTQKIVLLDSVLANLKEKKSPLKLLVARCLIITNPIIEKFEISKNDKFQELVKSDEEGNPVKTKQLKEAIKAGLIKPESQITYIAFEFEKKEGIVELKEYIKEINEVEVDVNFPSVKLSKLIRLSDGKDVNLEDLLDSPDSVITPDDLVILLETGIIVE
jgi:hypothetical protein